jgi:hypothetical protein
MLPILPEHADREGNLDPIRVSARRNPHAR